MNQTQIEIRTVTSEFGSKSYDVATPHGIITQLCWDEMLVAFARLILRGSVPLRFFGQAKSQGRPAAAQGFPSDYQFSGTKADITKQIGNSVSPPVARGITEAILCA